MATVHPFPHNFKNQEENTMPENIIRVHRPELTDEERERRMKRIKEAAARLIVAAEEVKKGKYIS